MLDPTTIDLSNQREDRKIISRVLSIIRGLRYGSIEIVVHDGRVVQIDRHEKFRMPNHKAKD
ncbi:MAG: YezD family protein [Gammaproteobacteria bacterium]